MTPTFLFFLSILGAVISAIIGTFWYSMSTPMGRHHMKVIGFDKLTPDQQKQSIDEMKPKMWKYYVAQLFLSLLTSFAAVYTVAESVHANVPFNVAMWFPIFGWLCFMVPAFGTAILWGNIDRKLAWKEFFSNILSHLVTILVILYVLRLFI